MALVVADRVQETSTTAGTGTLTLAGAVAGYQTFSTGIGNTNTTYYTIFDSTANVWEVGIGTVGAGTLARTTVLSNSSGNTSPLTLAGNTVNVWCDYPAGKAVTTDTLASPPAIGGTTAAAITGTNIIATAGVLATTAFTGSFTDGTVVDYASGNGRISVGSGDTLTLYTGGLATTQMGQFTSTGLNGTAVGATTASTGKFTTLAATGVLTASAGTSALPSIVTSSGSTSGFYSSTANVIGVAISAASIGTFTSTGLNGMAVGATTAAAGTFTALSATSNAVGSVTAATGGLTAVTAVAGTNTLTTGGVTIASQVMASGSVWRVIAYGTYAAASSANARTLTMACYWGTTALAAITTGNVLASTVQTTPWRAEFTITGSSATAAWVTGFMSSQVTSATIPLDNVATAASTTGLTTTSTLDFRVGQTGTATSTDTINVHSVVLERIK